MSSTIPYDLLHYLEDEYKNKGYIPKNDERLIKLRAKLKGLDNRPKVDRYRNNVARLLDEGYGIRSIAEAMDTSDDVILKVIRENELVAHPQFKYLAINKVTYAKIYSTAYTGYSYMVNCPSFIGTKINLANAGYELIQNKNKYTWQDIDLGDLYIVNGKINKKQTKY